MRRVMEVEADEFAMELLMPSAWLLKDVSGMDIDDAKLTKLAAKYRVSISVMAFRIGQLRERGMGQ